MIVEWIMNRMYWQDVWFLGYNHPAASWRKFTRRDSAYVGVWTGPQNDLICVRHCETNEEAERYLSPGGYTILHAALKSWLKRKRL